MTDPADAAPPPDTVVHASCVALAGRGLLITGASGRGKSALALQLMALGAALVADDRVALQRDGGRVMASAPAAIAGLIEARGLGLLHAAPAGPTPVFALLDLDRDEPDRLPPARRIDLLGQSVILLWRVDAPHFPAALAQYLRTGQRTL
ncbi:HPr kinase/phosphorylase [Antarcticimicrobium luteum]|uniref:Serine kinase n=1 Tax=Antarcticimicrobium luteum TaxID=2547397 RepID=A0A4V3ARH7_9RHOB|nr:HPr kinase/phosphatase C-terminal domain-containing protein [Antarcticimicrobium luteum]TDK46727.1 serine kinase [Antarcticimicrobium luteum]